jgi:DNA-binding beta-propeller fold protein YncE
MTHNAANSLEIFDLAKRRLVAQVTGLAAPRSLAVDAARGKVYVGNADSNSITVISSKDWKVEGNIRLPNSPQAMTMAPQLEKLFVANSLEHSVTSIDLAHGNKLDTAALNGTPVDLIFDSARGLLYVSLQDRGEILALDESLQVRKKMAPIISEPTGMALDAKGGRLWVAVRHAVVALDVNSGTETGRATAPAGVDSLWYDGSSGVLYAASDGGFVDIFRTSGGTLTAAEEIHTEVRGHSLAFDPVHKYIYLPGGREGRSKVLILKHVEPAQSSNLAKQ